MTEKQTKLLSMPTACPVTGAPLQVTRLECAESGVSIEGQFKPNEFALLDDKNLEFLRIFVKVRGNLKEAERILELSYPTVRLRFDNMLLALGYELSQDNQEEVQTNTKKSNSEILDLLEKGELSASEAAKQLRALKRECSNA